MTPGCASLVCHCAPGIMYVGLEILGLGKGVSFRDSSFPAEKFSLGTVRKLYPALNPKP